LARAGGVSRRVLMDRGRTAGRLHRPQTGVADPGCESRSKRVRGQGVRPNTYQGCSAALVCLGSNSWLAHQQRPQSSRLGRRSTAPAAESQLQQPRVAQLEEVAKGWVWSAGVRVGGRRPSSRAVRSQWKSLAHTISARCGSSNYRRRIPRHFSSSVHSVSISVEELRLKCPAPQYGKTYPAATS